MIDIYCSRRFMDMMALDPGVCAPCPYICPKCGEGITVSWKNYDDGTPTICQCGLRLTKAPTMWVADWPAI